MSSNRSSESSCNRSGSNSSNRSSNSSGNTGRSFNTTVVVIGAVAIVATGVVKQEEE